MLEGRRKTRRQAQQEPDLRVLPVPNPSPQRCRDMRLSQPEHPEVREEVPTALFDDILCPSNVQAAINKMAEELTGPYDEQNARAQAIEKEFLTWQNAKPA